MSGVKKKMPIIKNAHYEKNFALFDKTGLDYDDRLSWAAKGILCYMLAKPPNWSVNVSDLVSRSVDGKTVVYNALKELRHYGYISLKTETGRTKQFAESCYYVYCQPCDNPDPEDPATIPLGKKHQGTDKRKQYAGGRRTPHSENLNTLEKQGKSPRSENLKAVLPRSENLNTENLNDKKNEEDEKNNNLETQIFSFLSKRINTPSFNTWLRPCRVLNIGKTEAVIGVPDETFKYWLDEHYTGILQEAIEQHTGDRVDVRFAVQKGI